jgi:hypothetical protein
MPHHWRQAFCLLDYETKAPYTLISSINYYLQIRPNYDAILKSLWEEHAPDLCDQAAKNHLLHH